MLKEYKFGFNIYGLLLFLIIMIPNFIWFAVPAPDDVLRVESVTEMIDTIVLSRKLNDALSSRLFYAHFDSHRDISHFKSSCFCELFF